jgi:hypothetical protein
MRAPSPLNQGRFAGLIADQASGHPAIRKRRKRRPATLLRNVRQSGHPASDSPTSGFRLFGNPASDDLQLKLPLHLRCAAQRSP